MKKETLILSFPNATAAMKLKQAAAQLGIPGTIVPVPHRFDRLREDSPNETGLLSEPFTPKYEVCPMLESNAVDYYHLSKREIDRWCGLGCSPTCGVLLKEKMERGGRKQRAGEGGA